MVSIPILLVLPGNREEFGDWAPDPQHSSWAQLGSVTRSPLRITLNWTKKCNYPSGLPIKDRTRWCRAFPSGTDSYPYRTPDYGR
jgi:hypothetical protein